MSDTDSDISNDSDTGFACYEAKRLERKNNNINPINGHKRAHPADIDPLDIDTSISWDSIGGLSDHIRAIHEMIVLPLQYPELFSHFSTQLPRGVLFYGPPGTGKTLVARALVNTCSKSGKRFAFFMRKGADCLSKWVGEAERQLRLLFEEAWKQQPSIIFFDEIDGLAPVRSARQDYIHSSIVSTLLALMDGLDNRGQVIVIGATNRLDAIDPALRRPGRFDRELHFPLPTRDARREILLIHTKTWYPPLNSEFISQLADNTVGYCGADLRALCSEASLHTIRRLFPEIYTNSEKININTNSIIVDRQDFNAALSIIVPAAHRVSPIVSRALPVNLRRYLGTQLDQILSILSAWNFNIITGTNSSKHIDKNTNGIECNLITSSKDNENHCDNPNNNENEKFKDNFSNNIPNNNSKTYKIDKVIDEKKTKSLYYRLLIHAPSHDYGQLYIAPAILHSLEKYSIFNLSLPSLYSDTNCRSNEESLVRQFSEARKNSPSVLYLPHVNLWWDVASESLRSTLLVLLYDLPIGQQILFFATCDEISEILDEKIQNIFKPPHGILYELTKPSKKMFKALFKKSASKFGELKNITQASLTNNNTSTISTSQLDSLPITSKISPPLQNPPSTSCNIDYKKSVDSGVICSTLSSLSSTLVVTNNNPSTNSKYNHNTTVDSSEMFNKYRNKYNNENEDDRILLALRMCLRNICEKLMKRFRHYFTDPVDIETAPDYYKVIKNPICLSDILLKINKRQYLSISEFLNDIDLIVSNANEYNRIDQSIGRDIVNRVCTLQDMALSMVCQFSPTLARRCEEIASKQRSRDLNTLSPFSKKNERSHIVLPLSPSSPPTRRITRSKSSEINNSPISDISTPPTPEIIKNEQKKIYNSQSKSNSNLFSYSTSIKINKDDRKRKRHQTRSDQHLYSYEGHKFWKCQVCTYENLVSLNRCEMCNCSQDASRNYSSLSTLPSTGSDLKPSVSISAYSLRQRTKIITPKSNRSHYSLRNQNN